MARNKHKKQRNGNRFNQQQNNNKQRQQQQQKQRASSSTSRVDDYYEILGVSPDASIQDIKAAYRNLARQTHPDKLGNADGNSARRVRDANERFKKISEAYSCLSDEEKRREYDVSRLNFLYADSSDEEYVFDDSEDGEEDDSDDDDDDYCQHHRRHQVNFADFLDFLRSQSRDSGRASSRFSRPVRPSEPPLMFRIFVYLINYSEKIRWCGSIFLAIVAFIACFFAQLDFLLIYLAYAAVGLVVFFCSHIGLGWLVRCSYLYIIKKHAASWI